MSTRPSAQFYAKAPVIFPICAVAIFTAMRCYAPDPAGGANSALPDQTSWLDLGRGRKGKRERKGKGKGDGKRRGKKNGSGSEKRGRKEKGTKGRDGGGRKEKGRICAVVIFP